MRTISQLKVPEGFEPSRFEVTFEPYGWAPEGPEGKRLAVMIAEWTPSEGTPSDLKDLDGQNALFSMAAYRGPALDAGGDYSGIVEVRAKEPGRGTLYLVRAVQTRQ